MAEFDRMDVATYSQPMTGDSAGLIAARDNMVDCQLRPNKVTDRRVITAMRRLPRELFVPAAHRALAYADVEVPLGGGRFMLEPATLARLVQAALVPEGGSVLVLGAGYAAAVFAACGVRVTALEPDAGRAEQMIRLLTGAPISIVQGNMAQGWPEAAPYDRIFVDGAVGALPPIGDQLRAPTGRLVAALIKAGRNGVAVIAEPGGQGWSVQPLFDCAATPMPDFAPMPRFQF